MAKHSIHDVLAYFREAASSNRDLGDRFERLICRYLELDPIYAERFGNVWMFNEWPRKGSVGDIGIDVVAEERATGEFCGIQCKFFLPEHTISKEDIDSYFTALGNPLFTSGLIVSTTDRWGKNADHAIEHQTKRVNRLSVHDLDASPIDWSKFSLQRPQDLALRPQKKLRDDQKDAQADVLKGFAEADRGKLIMACGTGKTFTALKIAEKLAPTGHVLFLVPSLSLMSQSLREWTAESARPLHSLAVCSDTSIGKRTTKTDDDKGDITTYDLAFPATTSARQIVQQHHAIHTMAAHRKTSAQMTVVFSTYQSIDAVSQAQKAGLPEFDLIICDEAHRTTGVTLSGEDESHFVKVHDADFIKGRKRLYMTATPRVYGDEAKVKAGQADAELCSMDNVEQFGAEFHRLGFGEAVSKSLLSDYKVLVLAVDEKYVSKTFQRQIADANNELNLDDAVRITGCWNGLAKRFDQSTTTDAAVSAELQGDAAPMRRAVAFSRSIKDSKAFVEKFGQIVAAYRETHPDAENLLGCELDHVDGTFDALKRNARLDWLKAASPENTCRILSNARCLSEGVDVPALDAVLFLNPRKSIIDVVQSVGRVMRRAEGKKYGYIILPIGIPADVPAEEALKDNEKYKVVWQVYLYEKDESAESKSGEEKQLRQADLMAKEPEGELVDGYRRRSAITDAILADFRAAYEAKVTKEDIFYYVYGVLHSPEYRTRFASDLKKMLPRLPFTRETADFWRFSQAGRDLAQWHLNYETVEPWPVQEFASELLSDPAKDFLVQKMTFGRVGRVAPRAPSDEATPGAHGVTRPTSSGLDKSTIHYNARITLTGIPLEAYDYVVNGKPALEWIMERYQVTVDKDSGIRNDPNDWAREHNQPRYILDLLKRVVRVSLETMKIVNALPALNERK